MSHVLRIGIPFIFLALVIGGIMFAISHQQKKQASCADRIPPARIVAFGDSLVAGNGATIPGGFVTILSNELNIPITNLGKSGDTSAQAKERVTSVVAAQPNITLVLLGGNDALQQIPKEETQKNIGEIITKLKGNDSRVILLGVIGGFPDPYASMYESLAEAYDITYIPNVLSGIIGHQELMSDGVHPNQAGYQKVADTVRTVLEKECQKD